MKSKEEHHHHHHKKKRLRTVVSIVLSFVLSVFVGILLMAVAVKFGFFNKEMTLNKINESDYYNQVYKELSGNIQTILKSKDLPGDLVKDVITKKRVYINGKQYIDNSLNGRRTTISLNTINRELRSKLDTYYLTRGIAMDDAVIAGIKTTVNDIDSEYTRMIRFQFVDYIKQYKHAYQNVMSWLGWVLVAGSIVIIIVLIKLHKYPHRGVRYITISIMGASLMNLVLPLYSIVEKCYSHISIKPYYYKVFLQDYLKWSSFSFVYVGAIGIVVSAILFIWMRILKNHIH